METCHADVVVPVHLGAEPSTANCSLLGDAVNVTVYVTDMALYPELNEIYARRFPEPYPARTTVGVQSLPGGARVEIHVIARRVR